MSTKGKASSFLTLNFSCEQPSFHIGMRSLTLTIIFYEDYIDTFLAPSFKLNLPSRVTDKPKWASQEVKG
jgi:hypothetical protein